MFEFRLSYLEKGYHREGDTPFVFPPASIDDKIDGNLIEIEGRNGTGKTTLLNVLALALGYLDQEKNLETKPALKHKLTRLHENTSLEYYFRLSCEKPAAIDLRIQREKGQNLKCWLNSRPIGLDTLNDKFDIVFLTEDDPRKVVSASIGKLRLYFNNLEKGTGSLQAALIGHLQEIDGFRGFKGKEDELTKDIKTCTSTIEKKNSEFEELTEKLAKLKKKNEIGEKLKLLSEEDRITRSYTKLKKAYEQLCTKKDTDIARDLFRERTKLAYLDSEIKRIDRRVRQMCDSLREYGVQLDEKKLQSNDYCELNALNEKMQPKKKKEAVEMQMIDELLDLLRHHLDKEIVPVIKKTVAETRKELLKLKAQLASDRVFALLRVLNEAMSEKKKATQNFEKKETKISGLVQRNIALKDVDETQKAFLEAEEKYLDLQVALNDDRTELLSQWKEVSLFEGDSESIQDKLNELEIDLGTQETLKNKYSEKLGLLRANSAGKPEYYEREQEIKDLYQNVFGLRGNTARWMEILRNPEIAKDNLDKTEGARFGIAEYSKFVRAVGEYLGNQFEPIPYDYKQHNVRFFDIERNIFITTEGREIHIANLSQGQSKITSLTGSFRKMDPNKKKIVLIDEISELDPQNLESVKKTLKSKLEQGSLLLAILVRPSLEMIKIGKWD